MTGRTVRARIQGFPTIREMTPTTLAEPAPASSSADSPPVIEVEDLTKIYGSHQAIRGVTFSVGRGEILGFLGPNGAGKSTTMRILACYTPATSGRASVAGNDVGTQSFEARRKLGYLPENAPLYLGMKVRGFLRFMASVKEIPRSGRRAAVDRAIDECDLGEVAGRPIANLSKGFRQRVGLAQAILGDPAVLILDEPTVGLDPRQIAAIRELIRGMAGHRTVLLSTHILPEVSMICQRVVVIDRGGIVATGTPEKLTTASRIEAPPLHVTLRGNAPGAADVIHRVEGVEEVKPLESPLKDRTSFAIRTAEDADPRSLLARALVEANYELLEMTTPGVSLEDVFLRVISRPQTAGEES